LEQCRALLGSLAPGAFEFDLRGPAMTFAGLLTEQADLGPSRRITWDALLAFQRLFNHNPLVISGMTGWAVSPPTAAEIRMHLAKLD
jgi:hypothetical protein